MYVGKKKGDECMSQCSWFGSWGEGGGRAEDSTARESHHLFGTERTVACFSNLNA